MSGQIIVWLPQEENPPPPNLLSVSLRTTVLHRSLESLAHFTLIVKVKISEDDKHKSHKDPQKLLAVQWFYSLHCHRSVTWTVRCQGFWKVPSCFLRAGHVETHCVQGGRLTVSWMQLCKQKDLQCLRGQWDIPHLFSCPTTISAGCFILCGLDFLTVKSCTKLGPTYYKSQNLMLGVVK
jgi:hypothetical protein